MSNSDSENKSQKSVNLLERFLDFGDPACARCRSFFAASLSLSPLSLLSSLHLPSELPHITTTLCSIEQTLAILLFHL